MNCEKLARGIRVVAAEIDETVNIANLSSNNEEAIREFIEIAKPFMDPEKILALYEKVAEIDMTEMLNISDAIHAIDGCNAETCTGTETSKRYINELIAISEEVKQYVRNKENEYSSPRIR